jgi:hypothetical protein
MARIGHTRALRRVGLACVGGVLATAAVVLPGASGAGTPDLAPSLGNGNYSGGSGVFTATFTNRGTADFSGTLHMTVTTPSSVTMEGATYPAVCSAGNPYGCTSLSQSVSPDGHTLTLNWTGSLVVGKAYFFKIEYKAAAQIGSLPPGQIVDTLTDSDPTDTDTADKTATMNTGPGSITVDPTSTAVACAPASVAVGASTTCTATVTDTAMTASTPTGSVAFTTSGSGGSFSASSCTLSPSSTAGAAKCSVSYKPGQVGSGTETITGAYGGDASHAASSGPSTLTITASTLHPTSTAVACAPGSVSVGSASSCTATVKDTAASGATTPAGSVAFSTSGSGGSFSASSCTLAASATVGTGTCSVSYTPGQVGTGSETITGRYGGDTTHASSSGPGTLTVVAASGGTAPAGFLGGDYSTESQAVSVSGTGQALATQATISKAGTLSDMFVYQAAGISGSPSIEAAVYADKNGYPGAQIGDAANNARSSAGWLDMGGLSAGGAGSMNVTAGEKVWLVIHVQSSSTLTLAEKGGCSGQGWKITNSPTWLDDPWTTGGGATSDCSLSAYVTS